LTHTVDSQLNYRTASAPQQGTTVPGYKWHSGVSRSTLTAVGRSQLLARWPGTHSPILSGIQRAAQTVLGVYLGRTCSRVSRASSVLGVLNDYALYKLHALTHSLTHSAGSSGRPLPMLKYKYICQIKYAEAMLSNSTRKCYGLKLAKC